MLVVIDVIGYRFDRNDTSSSHVTYAGDVQEEFSAHMTFVFKRQNIFRTRRKQVVFGTHFSLEKVLVCISSAWFYDCNSEKVNYLTPEKRKT